MHYVSVIQFYGVPPNGSEPNAALVAKAFVLINSGGRNDSSAFWIWFSLHGNWRTTDRLIDAVTFPA